MPKKGYKQTEEHKEKLRLAGFKQITTEQKRIKCRLANLGKPKSDGAKEKLRLYHMGKKLSEETREKCRLSKLELAKDPEYLKKLSNGVRAARQRDPTILNRMSESSKRKWQDPQYRARLKQKHLEKWENSPERSMRRVELNIGGFWYGNVRYNEGPQYCEMWTEELRERCRAYFNYACVECGTPQNGRRLGVHHVHYNKKTCCDGSPRDLVPLCTECHSATNHNRKYWEQHFTEMLKAYYNGKCFFTKEEMKAYNS